MSANQRSAWSVTQAEQDAMNADQWLAWKAALEAEVSEHQISVGNEAQQYHQAMACLNSVMRAASHVLVGLPPSEKEAKLRDVLSKAHDWYMAEKSVTRNPTPENP